MAVRLVKGVQKVDGDAKAKTLTIEFDPQVTSTEAVKKAMARAGYNAEEV
jgi:copper chaperone CopZ